MQPGGPQPKEAWGFELRICPICGETKGGSPYRFCKCQREERGTGEYQPHLANDKPKFKKGDWVAQHGTSQPHFGRVKDLYADHYTGEWLVDIDMWTFEGSNPHRLSPPCNGPTTFEPACPATAYRQIEKPSLPMDRLRRGIGGEYDHLLKFV